VGGTAMASTRTRAETTAHAESVKLAVADIARFLQDTLGSRLTAHVAGVTDPKMVTKWASGTVKPGVQRETRLRHAYQIFQLLLEAEDEYVARAWFIGMNPELDDETPADVLRAGRVRDVMNAARAFLRDG